MSWPKTLGELRESGYQPLSVKEEMRKNLIAAIREGRNLFPGIIGYDETVIPQVENAILSGHDIVFLGERGQAKTRIARSLVNLLDDYIPVVANSEVNDEPFAPISQYGRDLLAEMGDAMPIAWLPRERRYSEKLATPDTTIADLIGEVDPIKVAEGRYLADELTIHFGLIPRVNRGIFCVNELPDLPERIQVGLFNLLEERDIQIRGYLIRLPLDVYVVASANPEDYTNRGRIITPLKDRYGAQIRTHYPRTLEDELAIVEQERVHFPDMDERVQVPAFMQEIVAEFTTLARRSPDINQRSGVSVRVTIANYETLLAAALRRAIRYNEGVAVPRMSDLPFIFASTAGKLELETVEEGREGRIIEELLKKAVLNVFNRTFNVREFDPLVQKFEEGLVVETGTAIPSFVYVEKLRGIEGFEPALRKFQVQENEALFASVVEFVLEGLHLNRRLNRDKVEGRFRYKG